MSRASLGVFSAAAVFTAAAPATAVVRAYGGTDTLLAFTRALVAACGAASAQKYPALASVPPEFDYVGGGSDAGGQAVVAGLQDIAPMGRELNHAEACATNVPAGPQGEQALVLAAGSQAEQWAIGRDAVSVFTSQNNALRQCGVADSPGFGTSLAFKGASIACGMFTPSIAPVPANLRWDLGSPNWADDDPVTAVAANALPAIPGFRPGDPFNASVLVQSSLHAVGIGSTFLGGPVPPKWPATGSGTDPQVPMGGVLTKTFGAGACNYPNPITGNDTATTYAFSDWRDVLRVLWAGADHNRFPNDAGGQTAQNRVDRCSSPIRQGLIVNWDNIVQHLSGASCSGGPGGQSCGKLRHVFRGDDLSAATNTFTTLLGLDAPVGDLAVPSATPNVHPRSDQMGRTGYSLGINRPFCNGRDFEDQDPIRVQCTTNGPAAGALADNDETCGLDQTTGLVVAIRVPTVVGSTNTSPTTTGNRRAARPQDLYPQVECTPGEFEFLKPPAPFNETQTCPDGGPFVLTGCRTPVVASAPGVPGPQHANCISSWTTRNVTAVDENGLVSGLQSDGRVWNRILRGDRVTEAGFSHFGNIAITSPVLRDERGDEVWRMDARMRYRPVKTPAKVCREGDAARQAGCLAQASDCSIGFGAQDAIVATASFPNAATGLQVGGVKDPTDPAACPASDAPGCAPVSPSEASIKNGDYSLSETLYVNSIVGVSAIIAPASTGFSTRGGELIAPQPAAASRFVNEGAGSEQAELMQCLLTEQLPLELALSASGLFPVAIDSSAPFKDPLTLTCP